MSNTITLDIDAILTEEERHDIAVEQFRRQCADAVTTKNDVERFVGNIAFTIVSEMVDKSLDGKLDKVLTAKVLENIEKLSDYSIFVKADRYLHPADSVGQQLLDKACRDNEHIIGRRVQEVFADISDDNLKDSIATAVSEALHEVFSSRDGSKL